jgi:hypothetical protein
MDSRHTTDEVLTELWQIKDDRAKQFKNLDGLIAHLRSHEERKKRVGSHAARVASHSIRT